MRVEPLAPMAMDEQNSARGDSASDREPPTYSDPPLSARARAEELKAVDLRWLEEPLWPPENFDGLAELRGTSGIPIAAGENVSTLTDFERLLAVRAVDFVQPSPAKVGGISELCKVFPLAAMHNVPVMPHSFYDGPGVTGSDPCHGRAGHGRLHG
jgi:hypothetical protein